jgi:hypothetical protein
MRSPSKDIGSAGISALMGCKIGTILRPEIVHLSLKKRGKAPETRIQGAFFPAGDEKLGTPGRERPNPEKPAELQAGFSTNRSLRG